MKVLGLIGDKTGMEARIAMPFKYLNKNRVARCGWMPLRDAVRRLRWGEPEVVLDHDLVVLLEPDDCIDLIEMLQAQGTKVVYETDADPRRSILERVDAVTTRGTWPIEASVPVHIVPDAINVTWFTTMGLKAKAWYPDRLTTMVVGSQRNAVCEILRAEHPTVVDLGVSTLPDWRFPAFMRQVDILCVALSPDDQGSNIQVLEGWAAARPLVRDRIGGCAVVATDCPACRGTIRHRDNGLLVGQDGWSEALHRVIDDQVARRKYQYKGHRSVSPYDIRTRWTDWHRAYQITIGGEYDSSS